MVDEILINPFEKEIRIDLTCSPHKAYELAIEDMIAWLTLHNEAHNFKQFALSYPFALNEDDYWALRQRGIKE